MIKNVCRPMYIYDNYLMKSEQQDWEWVSFGYYDGIDIGSNMMEDPHTDFSALWNEYVDLNASSINTVQRRILWLMRSENETSFIKDTEFWADAKRYPFMIVSLVQVYHDKGYMDNWKFRNEFEENVGTKLKNGKMITYMTIDNSDMIIVQLTRSYEEATGFISSLHTESSLIAKCLKWRMFYSYSIASVNAVCLMDSEKSFADDSMTVLSESLDEAYVFLVERKMGGISKVAKLVEDKLKESCDYNKIDEKTVLGCNDGLLIIRNVPWKAFLALYSKSGGILNQHSLGANDNLVGITTIISGVNNYHNHNTTDEITDDCDNQIVDKDCFEPVNIQIPYVDRSRKEGIDRAMTLIKAALYKHEQNEYHDYLSCYISNVIDAVKNMSEEVDSPSKAEDFISSFYMLTKGINILIQDTERSDRQFTQRPDYSIRLYDFPTKLSAFYNAFVQKMICFLGNNRNGIDQERHFYNFLLYPCLTGSTHAVELFCKISQKHRILLMEVPEHQMYSPQNLLFMLAHETGHFVGTEIRNRKYRYKATIEVMADILSDYYFYALREYCNVSNTPIDNIDSLHSYDEMHELLCFPKEILDSDAQLKEYLGNLFARNDKSEGSDKRNEQYDKTLNSICARKWHTDTIEKVLPYIYYDLLSLFRDKLWDKADYSVWSYWLKDGLDEAARHRREFQNYMVEVTDSLYKQNIYQTQLPSVQSLITDIHYLFRECFSDLIAILTFQLKPDDYVRIMVGEVSSQSKGHVVESVEKKNHISIRCALVLYCMIYPFSKNVLGYTWSIDDWNNLDGDSSVMVLKSQINDVVVNHIQNDTNSIEFAGNFSMDWLISKKSLTNIIKYLLKCKRDFASHISTVEKHNLQSELIKTYKTFSLEEKDMSIIICEIQKIIDDALNTEA